MSAKKDTHGITACYITSQLLLSGITQGLFHILHAGILTIILLPE